MKIICCNRNQTMTILLVVGGLLLVGCAGFESLKNSDHEQHWHRKSAGAAANLGFVNVGGTSVAPKTVAIGAKGLQLQQLIEGIPAISSSAANQAVYPDTNVLSSEWQRLSKLQLAAANALDQLSPTQQQDFAFEDPRARQQIAKTLAECAAEGIELSLDEGWIDGYLEYLKRDPGKLAELMNEIRGDTDSGAETSRELLALLAPNKSNHVQLDRVNWQNVEALLAKYPTEPANYLTAMEDIEDIRDYVQQLQTDERQKFAALLENDAEAKQAYATWLAELESTTGAPKSDSPAKDRLAKEIKRLNQADPKAIPIEFQLTGWVESVMSGGGKKEKIKAIQNQIQSQIPEPVPQGLTRMVSQQASEQDLALVLDRFGGSTFIFPVEFLRHGPMGGLQLQDNDRVSFFPMSDLFPSTSSSQRSLMSAVNATRNLTSATNDMVVSQITLGTRRVTYIDSTKSARLEMIPVAPEDRLGFANSQLNPLLLESRMFQDRVERELVQQIADRNQGSQSIWNSLKFQK